MPSLLSTNRPPRVREALRLAVLPAALLLAAALAACGESTRSPVAPSTEGTTTPDAATTAQISTDVAHDAGDASATLNETFGSSESVSGASISLASGGAGLAFSAAPSSACGGPDASGFYTCAKTKENDFSIARAWRYWSGGSVALRYAETTTDSVNHRWTLSGSHAVADTSNGGTTRSVNVSRADTSTMQVVRGAAPQHVWNGVGVRNDTSVVKDKNGTRSYVVTAFDTAKGVAYAQPRKSNVWPLAGTITHNVRTVWTGVTGATTTTTRRAVVTFNGTQTATIQVGALACSLDLKTHQATGCK